MQKSLFIKESNHYENNVGRQHKGRGYMKKNLKLSASPICI